MWTKYFDCHTGVRSLQPHVHELKVTVISFVVTNSWDLCTQDMFPGRNSLIMFTYHTIFPGKIFCVKDLMKPFPHTLDTYFWPILKANFSGNNSWGLLLNEIVIKGRCASQWPQLRLFFILKCLCLINYASILINNVQNEKKRTQGKICCFQQILENYRKLRNDVS